MSLKYNVPLGVFMLFIFSAAGAQQGMNLFDHMLIKLSEKTLYGDPAQEKVVGTPYLSEDFVIGDVYDNKGKYAGVPMRYNIYEDQIEFKQNGQLYILDPQPKIKKVDLDHRTFVVSQYEYRGKTRPGYFFLLDSGKVILMSKKVVTYREQQPPKALESGPTPAKYSKSPDVFFYKIGNGEVMKVDNIKNMIAGFPDRQTELNEFVKKEKISSRKEDELIKLVRYYNSL